MEISKSIQILKALSDSSRLMILNSLMEESQCVEELANRMNLAASTVSFHLKKLEQAELVRRTKEQYYVIFRVNEQIFSLTLQEIISFRNNEKPLQQKRLENYRQTVLDTFFKKNKLIRFPSQQKKQRIVLEEISGFFERGSDYTEDNVNQILSGITAEPQRIRLALLKENLLEKVGDVYRRSEVALPPTSKTISREKENDIFLEQPAKDVIETIWITKDKVRSDNENRSYILLLNEKKMYFLDNARKTYTVIPLDLGESKKIRNWNCKKYIQTIETQMGPTRTEIWASEDIHIDYDNKLKLFR